MCIIIHTYSELSAWASAANRFTYSACIVYSQSFSLTIHTLHSGPPSIYAQFSIRTPETLYRRYKKKGVRLIYFIALLHERLYITQRTCFFFFFKRPFSAVNLMYLHLWDGIELGGEVENWIFLYCILNKKEMERCIKKNNWLVYSN